VGAIWNFIKGTGLL